MDVEGDLATIRQLVWSKGDGGTGTEIRRLKVVGGGLGIGELEGGCGDWIEVEGEIAVVSADEGFCDEPPIGVRARIEAARFTGDIGGDIDDGWRPQGIAAVGGKSFR